MSNLTQTLQDLPWTGLIPVVLMVVMGVLLWAFGRKILRAGFAVAGFIVGGLLGLMIGEALGLGISPWITAAIGAILLSLAAAFAYRIAVAVAMALIFAVAAPLSVVTVVEIQAKRAGVSVSDGEVHNPVTDAAVDWLERHDNPEARKQAGDALKTAGETAKKELEEKYDRAKDALSEKLGGKSNEQIEDLERFSKRLLDAGKNKWQEAPPKLRPTLILSSVFAAIVGFMLGLVAPDFSASAVTAVGGSLMWLTGLRILLVRLGVPEGPWMPTSGMAWLGIWLITALVGLGIQWTFRKRRADKQT